MSDKKATESKPGGLSSAKREDIWALIIAAAVMGVSVLSPDGVYRFFKDILYLF